MAVSGNEPLRQTPAPDAALSARGWLLRLPRALWHLSAERLREHNVPAMSAALSFRTIFALIPLLVLGLLVAKSLGALEDGKRSLRHFLEASGFDEIVVAQDSGPAAAQPDSATTAPAPKVINVADEIEKVVTGVESKLTVARIGPIGGLLLVWTAVGLLTNIEQSLNRIFGATRSRSHTRRLLLYWSVLTLSPIVLLATKYLGERIVATFGDTTGLSGVLGALGRIGPFVILVLVLAAIYKLLPNTRVRYRSAIGGAAVAATLWLLAKWAFGLYVDQLVLKGNLYGVLGALPLFMLWLYYSWLIFLAGAVLADTAVHVRELETAQRAARTVLGPSDLLAAAAAVAQPFLARRGPVPLDEVAASLRLPNATVQPLLDRLATAGVLCTVDDETALRYVPARPAESILVSEILDLADPRPASAPGVNYEPQLAALLTGIQGRTRTALGTLTLGDVLTGRGNSPQ